VDERLTTNELTVLALVAERSAHGWALAAKLARGGEIGQIWSVSRPIVYHALDRLGRAGLVRTVGLERGGRGPHRVIYAATSDGKERLASWLATPVENVRDIRSLFLLKVVLTQRAGGDPEPLLVAQRAVLIPFVAWVEARADELGPELPGETTAAAFRLETATAIVRFIDRLLDGPAVSPSGSSGSAPRSAPGTP
jgi:PadR family transcriptional regulator AphA